MEHAPTYTQVPPADSIGRHLCEVACSCAMFHMTASSAQASAAYADAEAAFAAHRERASQAVPARERRPVAVTAHAPPPASRRRAPLVAGAAVGAVVLGAVLVAVVVLGQDRDYSGAPTLVGGPDRTGPAVLDPGDAEPQSDDDPLTREDGYAELRAVSPEFVAWTELEIDRASAEVCRLLDAGRAIRGTDPALVAFAEAFDCGGS